VLLQPRDYLNSFLLYGMMLLGILSIFVANPEIRMTPEIHLKVDNLGYLFPVLFVTIACGAISGFHSMVASGTTSKQLNRETDARRVGYGGMLIETLLAVVAVCAVIVLSRDDYMASVRTLGPVTLYAQSLGGFMASLGIPSEWAVSFVALTVSAFAVTTLDTCTRLARFVLQEFFQPLEGRVPRLLASNRHLATGIVAALSVGLLLTGQFSDLWPIFGSANTLLAALSLLAVSVWLRKTGISSWVTLVPMLFMFLVAISSLATLAVTRFAGGDVVLGILAAILLVFALVLIVLARASLKRA
jgi:carbon starvation protein